MSNITTFSDKELCKLIGCSGVNSKCPGNTTCGILRMFKTGLRHKKQEKEKVKNE